MPPKSLEAVKTAESEAYQKINDAKKKEQDILKDARSQAEAIHESAKKRAENEISELEKRAQTDTGKAVADIKEAGLAEREKVEKGAEKNLDKAVTLIVDVVQARK